MAFKGQGADSKDAAKGSREVLVTNVPCGRPDKNLSAMLDTVALSTRMAGIQAHRESDLTGP